MYSAFEKLGDVVSYSGSVILEMLSAEKYKNTRTEFLAGKIYEFMASVFEGEEIKTDYVKAVSDMRMHFRFLKCSKSTREYHPKR